MYEGDFEEYARVRKIYYHVNLRILRNSRKIKLVQSKKPANEQMFQAITKASREFGRRCRKQSCMCSIARKSLLDTQKCQLESSSDAQFHKFQCFGSLELTDMAGLENTG